MLIKNASNCLKISLLSHKRASLVAQTVKHLPAMQETQVQSLSWEDLQEKEMATHSSTLAWKIPWTEEPGSLQSMGLQRMGHDWATSLSLIPASSECDCIWIDVDERKRHFQWERTWQKADCHNRVPVMMTWTHHIYFPCESVSKFPFYIRTPVILD